MVVVVVVVVVLVVVVIVGVEVDGSEHSRQKKNILKGCTYRIDRVFFSGKSYCSADVIVRKICCNTSGGSSGSNTSRNIVLKHAHGLPVLFSKVKNFQSDVCHSTICKCHRIFMVECETLGVTAHSFFVFIIAKTLISFRTLQV